VRCPPAFAIVVAAMVHLVALVLVGGDWMPFSRLLVPIVPGLVYAAALVSSRSARWSNGVRLGAGGALAVALVLQSNAAIRDARRVGHDRAALVAVAASALRGASSVAALDVGWVGAATDASIVDLAGLTDPEIAALPGGHTSKRIDGGLLLSRHPGVLLLYAPFGLPSGELSGYTRARYTRAVEYRLSHDERITQSFVATQWLALGASGAGYVLLRRVEPPGKAGE
jgi:hypothetical protein